MVRKSGRYVVVFSPNRLMIGFVRHGEGDVATMNDSGGKTLSSRSGPSTGGAITRIESEQTIGL
jgi:hypothetical protein